MYFLFWSKQQFNTNFDVQNKGSVVLPIQRFCDIRKIFSSPEECPLESQKRIHAIDIFDSDSIMSWSTAISSVENTLKNIYPGGTLLGDFTST